MNMQTITVAYPIYEPTIQKILLLPYKIKELELEVKFYYNKQNPLEISRINVLSVGLEKTTFIPTKSQAETILTEIDEEGVFELVKEAIEKEIEESILTQASLYII